MGVLLLNGSDHNGQRAQNVGAPQIATDAANRGFVETLVSASVATTVWHVVVTAGQSNMSGYYANGNDVTNLDFAHPKVYMWPLTGSLSGVVTRASEPLPYKDNAAGIGPAMEFARLYADSLPAGHRVLLVPAAFQSTGFSSTGTNSWNPATSGTTLYSSMVAGANAAVAAINTRPASQAVVSAFLWLQGETDAQNSVTGSQYTSYLTSLISGVRAAVTGASAATPFIIGRMLPTWVAGGTGTAKAIDDAHAAIPASIAYTAVTSGPQGLVYDSIHYNAEGGRANGRRMFEALTTATLNTTPAVTVAPKPYTVTATPGQASLAVAWETPAGSGGATITDYTIQYRTTGSTPWTTFAHTATTARTASITGLTTGTPYDVRVAAVTSAGTGAFSTVISAIPAAAAPSTLAADNFNRSDSNASLGTAADGGTWTVLGGGTWGISGNKATVVSAVDGSLATREAGQADMVVSAVVTPTGTASDYCGVAARATDTSNMYVAIASVSGNTLLYKVVSGTFTALQTVNGSFTTSCTLGISAIGSTIKMLVNGTVVATVTDTAITSGTKAGMRNAGTTAGKTYDDFTANPS